MSLNPRVSPPAWFWGVSIILLLWSAMGCFACIQQFRLGAEAMGPATSYDRALYAALPGWYNWVYAVAVGTGLLGAAALLTRRAAALILFIVSLGAIILQFGYLFGATDMIAVKGIWTTYFPLFIAAVALFSVWFAGLSKRRGWIS